MWIKCKAAYRPYGVSEDTWESYSQEQQNESYIWSDFRFKSEEVIAYNECNGYQNGKMCRVHFRYHTSSELLNFTVHELDAIIENIKPEIFKQN